MAATTLSRCLPLHVSSSINTFSNLSFHTLHYPQIFLPSNFHSSLSLSLSFSKPSPPLFLTRSSQNDTESDTPPPPPQKPDSEPSDQLSEVGAELKKVLGERQSPREGWWSGVGEEIGEIEWPEFGKVLGTTGVVLAVISGSSLVLLSLNALLSQLSDSLFAGRGVQDLF